ncbi:hypothetical protein KW834_09695 [Pseudomonas sp. PDM29]|nr:hypothetical protein [Pseudomonas sp. PDM29]
MFDRQDGGALWAIAELSLRRHQYSERHVDKLFVLADRCQRAAHITSNFTRAALLNPVCELHDRSFKSQLILIDLEE